MDPSRAQHHQEHHEHGGASKFKVIQHPCAHLISLKIDETRLNRIKKKLLTINFGIKLNDGREIEIVVKELLIMEAKIDSS